VPKAQAVVQLLFFLRPPLHAEAPKDSPLFVPDISKTQSSKIDVSFELHTLALANFLVIEKASLPRQGGANLKRSSSSSLTCSIRVSGTLSSSHISISPPSHAVSSSHDIDASPSAVLGSCDRANAQPLLYRMIVRVTIRSLVHFLGNLSVHVHKVQWKYERKWLPRDSCSCYGLMLPRSCGPTSSAVFVLCGNSHEPSAEPTTLIVHGKGFHLVYVECMISFL